MADIKLVGNDDNGGTSNHAKDYFVIQRFQAVASGSISSIKIKAGSNVQNVMVALYSDDAGSINELLAYSASTACSSGWNMISVSPAVNITEGTYYWLAFNSSYGYVYYYSGSGYTSYRKSVAYSGFTFPNPAGTGFSSISSRDTIIAAWGAATVSGCPRQAMYFKMMG